jgi:hypothetical protein
MTGIEDTLVGAIRSRRLVEFRYRRLPRVAEPHTLGVNTNDVEQLLAYQIGGRSSSTALPGWRLFDVDAIEQVGVRHESFPRRAAPSGEHIRWKEILAFVPAEGE